jgi:hypothetical protein
MMKKIKSFFSDIYEIVVEVRTMQAQAHMENFKEKPSRCTK